MELHAHHRRTYQLFDDCVVYTRRTYRLFDDCVVYTNNCMCITIQYKTLLPVVYTEICLLARKSS